LLWDGCSDGSSLILRSFFCLARSVLVSVGLVV